MTDGSTWPRISIVTPSFNQGEFIEETIRSVLLQGYPNLEYIIIDGGSTDETVSIIKKYEKWLAYWVSEPDRGQAHALSKGIAKAEGDIFAWINSDDLYCKGAFEKAVNFMWERGGIAKSIIYSDLIIIDELGKATDSISPLPVTRENLIRFWKKNYRIPQPTVFMRRDLIHEDMLDLSLHFVFDWDLWIMLSETNEFHYLNDTLAMFRVYDKSKTGSGWIKFINEHRRALRKYGELPGQNYVTLWINSHVFLIRYFYHNIFRARLRAIVERKLGPKSFNRIRELKSSWLPFLSKDK